MTTVINNPGNKEEADSFIGIIMGVLLILLTIAVFFIYALPAIKSGQTVPQESTVDVNVKLPPVVVTPPDEALLLTPSAAPAN